MNVYAITTVYGTFENRIETICRIFSDKETAVKEARSISEEYKIWIIEDGSRKDNSPYHRVCYLKNNIEDMFVSGDNIHYFENTDQYRYLTEYYGNEIMNILK